MTTEADWVHNRTKRLAETPRAEESINKQALPAALVDEDLLTELQV